MFFTNSIKRLAFQKTIQTNIFRNIFNINAPQIKSIYRLSATRYKGLNNTRSSSSKSDDSEFEVNPDPALRIVRPLYPSPSKFCLIPETYFTFFHTKTGVTGFYTFAITFGTYLFSKEVIVMEHEFYNGISMVILCWMAVKYAGPGLGKYLDNEVDLYEAEWNLGRELLVKNLNKQIEQEEYLQWSKAGEAFLCEAKRQTVLIQLESEYRERLMRVYQQIKRRLDYQVSLVTIEYKFIQRNMIAWVVAQVVQAWTAELDAKHFDANLERLKELAQEHKKAQ